MGLTVSVLMPMYNAGAHIERCLEPLLRMKDRNEVIEVIVIDDCSTDHGPDLVRKSGAVLLRTDKQSGPAAARNHGVAVAKGDLLWFVDSDVIVEADCAAKVIAGFTNSKTAAVFGSYDEAPDAQNFLSQYKNLVHHFYHQAGQENASTFWAGCGAIRASVYHELNGFDAVTYAFPSIEDIDLGYRIREAGYQILLLHKLKCKHLKEWRFVNLIHTEIFRRAMPWSRLMLRKQSLTNDLNVSQAERFRAALAGLGAAACAGWAFGWLPSAGVAIGLAVVVVANARFIDFFMKRRGIVFAVRAFLFHQLYYLYSAGSFALVAIETRVKSLRGPSTNGKA